MILPVGIRVTAFAAGALSTINNLAERLRNMGGSATIAGTQNLEKFKRVGMDATSSLSSGFEEAQSAWYKLGGALGVPMSLAGVFAAVSGIGSLKSVLVDSNVELENAHVNMSARLRDWNDTKETASFKADKVMSQIEDYAAVTPFDTRGLTSAAVQVSSFTKDPAGVMAALKLIGRVSAIHGDTDPTGAAGAFSSAMNGNFVSLDQTYGIKANQDTINTLAGSMGMSGQTMRGKYAALEKLILQKTGGVDGDPIGDLSKTGQGAMSTVRDNLSMPFTQMSKAGYNAGVKALFDFGNALGTFEKSKAYHKIFAFMEGKFLSVGQGVAKVLDTIGNNLENIPAIFAKYGPAIKIVGAVVGGIAALNVALLVAKGVVGGAFMMLQRGLGLLTPGIGLLTNPALLLAIGAIAAVMWPFAKGMEIGGKSLDDWMKKAQTWASGSSFTMFDKTMAALKKLVSGAFLQDGKPFNLSAILSDAFGADSLPAQIATMSSTLLGTFTSALMKNFPQVGVAVTNVTAAFQSFYDNAVLPVHDYIIKNAAPAWAWLKAEMTVVHDYVKTTAVAAWASLSAAAVTVGASLKASLPDALLGIKTFLVQTWQGVVRLKDGFLAALPQVVAFGAALLPMLPTLARLAEIGVGLLVFRKLAGFLSPLVPVLQAVGVALAPLLGGLASAWAALGTGLSTFFGGMVARFAALGAALSSNFLFQIMFSPASLARSSLFLTQLGPLIASLALLGGPLIAGGLFVLSSVFYGLGKNVTFFGKTVDEWLSGLGDKSASTNWVKIFTAPITFLQKMFGGAGGLLGGKWDAYKFWQNLFAPDSLFARIKGILDPVWKGFMGALDAAFPDARGWFTDHFGDMGNTIGNVLKTVSGIVVPIVQGIVSGVGMAMVVVKPILGMLLALGGFAWDTIKGTFAALSATFGNQNLQGFITGFTKFVTVAAVAIGVMKAAMMAYGAASTLAGKFSSPGAGLAIAALTIVAASVALYTQKIEDNVKQAAFWNNVTPSDRKDTGGMFMAPLVHGLQSGKLTGDHDSVLQQGSILGFLNAMTRRNFGVDKNGTALDTSGVSDKTRGEFADYKSSGADIFARIQTQVGQMDMTNATKEQIGAVAVMEKVQNQIRTLKDKADSTHTMYDEKTMGGLIDRYARMVGVLQRTQAFKQDIIPADLIPALKILGITVEKGLPYDRATAPYTYNTSYAAGGKAPVIPVAPSKPHQEPTAPAYAPQGSLTPRTPGDGLGPIIRPPGTPGYQPLQPASTPAKPGKTSMGNGSGDDVADLNVSGGMGEQTATLNVSGGMTASALQGGQGGGVSLGGISVPVTIYANQLAEMSKGDLAAAIAHTLTTELPRQLHNALNGIRSA